MEALFALLRAGLKGAAPDADLFSGEVPWERLYTLSDEQAVSPLVTDGIEMLPDARKPGIELLEPFLADTMATEIRNDTMDRFAGGLFGRSPFREGEDRGEQQQSRRQQSKKPFHTYKLLSEFRGCSIQEHVPDCSLSNDPGQRLLFRPEPLTGFIIRANLKCT